MMTTIITTTGISLLQNTGRKFDIKTPSDDQMRQYLRTDPDRASAETNSLLKFAQVDDQIVLLHTDTPDALNCARLIRDFLEKQEYKFIRLSELKLEEDEQQLESRGLRNLVNTLITEVEQAQKRNQEVIINATSGFKAEVVYSTMVGMLYQVPIKYIYENFQRLVTFNPIPLNWDTSLILEYDWFFNWIDSEPRHYDEVEKKLQAISDVGMIRAFLTPPDLDGSVFLSAIGEALLRRFKRETEEAEQASWPPTAEIEKTEDKITESILKAKHHPIKGLKDICYKIAELDPVRLIIGGHFENTTLSRIKGVYDDGTIRLLWADNEKAENITIFTTAQGRAQTRKVADRIKEMIEV